MTSILDIKAYAIRAFFDSLGRLGSPILNLGASRNMEVYRDLPYGPEPGQRLDILRPKGDSSGGRPVLVYFHGGGWISADKRFYDGICATLSKNGYLVFNINYRLAPKSRFPAPLQDAVRAVDWVDRNARHYGGNRSIIVLAGDSAGAQIAAWYASALHKDSLFAGVGLKDVIPKVPVRGLLLFYGVYDFHGVRKADFPFIKIYVESFLGTDPVEYAVNSDLASPIRHISNALPPIFLCAGKRDGLFGQSTAYADALEKRGLGCRSLFFTNRDRADHGFLFFRWRRPSKEAFAAAGEFLRGLAKAP